MEKEKKIMNAEEMKRIVHRLSSEVVERNIEFSDLCLIGIKRRGVTLAKRIKKNIEDMFKILLPMGAIDITLYRDDLALIAQSPVIHGSEIDFDINDKNILLVDDVIFTGRTVRAAISELLDYGRPKRIELAVLIDRGHRELPIHPDYTGRKIDTDKDEIVDVKFVEDDGEDGVYVRRE